MYDLTNSEITQLNDFKQFLKFERAWHFDRFVTSPAKVLAFFTGNQTGKTCGAAYSYVLRCLSMHPIAVKNVEYWECEQHFLFKDEQITEAEFRKNHKSKEYGGGIVYEGAWNSLNIPETCPHCGGKVTKHERSSHTFRFASETLPGQSGSIEIDGAQAEVKNTQYPEFKKWLPPFLIRKDITFRNPALVIKNIHGNKDIIVEFISYNQSIQSTAGTQRVSVWTDEEPSQEFIEEQKPRLLAEDGDWVVTLTPANYISWMYDEVFEKAKVYYRSEAICKFLREENPDVKQIETTESDKSICVVQAATDDNPTLKKRAIEDLLGEIDDPDVLAIRRYGIFKQVSGRIFKDFEYKVHVINRDKYFEENIPHGWTHARGIDYHPQTPWAFGAVALSPTNEVFVYEDLNLSPEKFDTLEIAERISRTCKDYKYKIDLVDPLIKSSKQGTDSSGDPITLLDVLNDAFYKQKREGSTGGYWETWDTKGEKGRDEIRKRLKNSRKVGKPFNNTVIEKGMKKNLPTIWILNNCKNTAQSLRQWRWEQYTDKRTANVKGEKNTPEQKWSHFCMVIEAIFKDSRFRIYGHSRREERKNKRFQGAR
jgi:hypothetical protein